MAGNLATIVAFFAGRPGQSFCSECIAFGTSIALDAVRGGLSAISKEIVINTQIGVCSECQRGKPTYGLLSDDVAADEAVVCALGTTPPPGICQTCLARQVGLTLHDVQKAFWRLRASSQARLATDRCSRCDRVRMLMQSLKQNGGDPGAPID